VSKVVVIETQKQLVGVVVTQSFDVGIITTGAKTVVAPTMDVVKRGVLIGSTTKLGNGSSGVLARKKSNGNTTLPITIIGVVGTLQTMFTNPIMTIHVNRIAYQPSMSSMVVRKYKCANVTNLRKGYQKPFVVIAPIPDHKYGHYVRPNRVALKYHDFKKDVDIDAHVKVLSSIVKTNTKTFEDYIINEFNYMLKDTTLD
jgi:hypothetical protein